MVQCMNVLDVLVSLTVYTMTSEGVMCKPDVVPPSAESQVKFGYANAGDTVDIHLNMIWLTLHTTFQGIFTQVKPMEGQHQSIV